MMDFDLKWNSLFLLLYCKVHQKYTVENQEKMERSSDPLNRIDTLMQTFNDRF